MATFRFELSGRPTKNNTYVVYLRITVAGKRQLIKTPVEIHKKSDFNAKTKRDEWIRSSVYNANALNDQLYDILSRAKETYKDLDKTGAVSTSSLVRELNTETVASSFMKFARERAQHIYDTGGLRNHKKYMSFINKLEGFMSDQRMRDISFEDLTPEFLSKFDNYLHKQKNQRHPDQLLHPNTIEVQFNVFKAIINRGVELGMIDASKNPFIAFKYKGVTTVKEKLTPAELEKILELDLKKDSLIWHCRNYFMFSFYCGGIRIGDLLQLRWKHITNTGRLQYRADKTHKGYDLILVNQALNILEYYQMDEINGDNYIFPLLDSNAIYAKYVSQKNIDTMPNEVRKMLHNDISAKTALINKYLKQIAQAAGLSKSLSNHISRHTFASIAQNAGVGSAAIKEILGHSNLATTERYMGNFDTSRTDATLMNLFGDKSTKEAEVNDKELSKKELAIKLLSELDAMDFVDVINSIKKNP